VSCLHCGEPIDPRQKEHYPLCPDNLHIECAVRMTIGSVGHQTCRCACFGGTEEDPPGMTKRMAALSAFKLWEARRGRVN
jgi:hypothetical protein